MIPFENLRDLIGTYVTAKTRATDSLQIFERRRASGITRLGFEKSLGPLANFFVRPDVAFLLEDASDLLLHLRVGCGKILLLCHGGILEAREEV
jgi:hypothetical protein